VIEDTTARARDRVGTVVNGKWQLEGLLGAGGMACVYSAVHRNGRRVAIKVLHPQLCAVQNIVTRFLREGYLANRVGHPGAVAVLDDDRTADGAVFLVMELLEGHSLERYAKVGRERLPRGTVIRLMAETLDVLAAAHAKGIVHRDIKPANLFLTSDGHIKVLDFGIARLAEPSADGLTQTGAAIGTPSFMPPEQARGRWEQVDARTDVWAVGATMFALLTGDRPRHAETTQEEMLLAMTQPLAPLRSVLPDIGPDVAAVVDRAVAHEREGRWPDATAMRDAVAGLLGNAANAEGPLPAAWRPSGTTPAFHGGSSTLAVQESSLTTGRPFASQPLTPSPSTSRAGPGAVFAIAAVMTLGVLAVAGVVVARRHGAPAGPPVAATTLPGTSTAAAATTATAAPMVSTTTISPADTPAEATTQAPSAVPAAPSPSVAATTSKPPGASPATSARPVAHPGGPRGPAANPFDQRF
jgi:serine/threonine-protein kinase